MAAHCRPLTGFRILRTHEGNQIVTVDNKYAYTVPRHIPDLAVGDKVRVPNPPGLGFRIASVTELGTTFTGALQSILRVQARHTSVS